MLQGETPLSGLMATKVLEEYGSTSDEPHASSEYRIPLTEREQQVLELLVEGLSNAEIAVRAYLSVNTIKKHIKNILEKLHLNNRVKAAVYAIREGLVD